MKIIAKPIVCLVAAFLVAAPSTWAQDPAPDDGSKAFEEGRSALFRGEIEHAITSLERAVSLDEAGEKTVWRLHLARAYRYGDRAADAVPLLRGILERSPDHVEAGQLLAEVLRDRQEWKALVDVLKPLLAYRHDYLSHHLLAEACYRLDRNAEALTYYREAVRLNPSSFADHYQIGNIHLADNRFSSAAASYREAQRLGLQSHVLNFKLASAYFNLRNYFGRIEEVTVASGEVGKIVGVHYLIEVVPGRENAFYAAPEASAIYQVARAIEGGGDNLADMRLLMANIHLNARRYETAYAMYHAIADQVPEADRALYHYYVAESAFGIGKYDEYLTSLEKAAELDQEAYRSTLIDAFLKVADRFNQAGELERYIEFLGKAVAERPETASLHLRLGDALAEAKQWKRAVLHWRMVLDLEPDHPQRTELLNRIATHGR